MPVDIVLTHAQADFDSLAAAVGLARLISPHANVVLPAGVHIAVRRYLSLHKSFFPIVDARLVDEEAIRHVAVVDTRSRKRLGSCAAWLENASSVTVVDHHACVDATEIREQDYENVNMIVEDVGAASTLVVEMLMKRDDIVLSEAESTLLALGIHTDTGSLSFESTTPRDAAALSWLLARGASQRSISQFARNYLTTPQQRLLANALDTMHVRNVDGLRLADVVLEADDFVKGMAGVAQAALELANIDCLVLAVVAPSGRKGKRGVDSTKQVSIIGRAVSRVDGVDFGEIFKEWGGGGHASAAAMSIKVRGGEEVGAIVETVLERVLNMLPPPTLAEDFMSRRVVSVTPEMKMSEAKTVLFESGHTGLCVVKDEGCELVGVISRQDVALAKRRGLLDTPVKGWLSRKTVSVERTTPLHEIEALLVDNNFGRLPVVEDGKVIGIVTRSDVLIQRRLCGAE